MVVNHFGDDGDCHVMVVVVIMDGDLGLVVTNCCFFGGY